MTKRVEEGTLLALRQEPASLSPRFDDEGQMSFQRRSPGCRYYLDDHGIHAGDLLEILWSDDRWQPVRFEWNFEAESKPVLFTNEETGFAMSEEMRFRWPDKNSRGT